MLRRSSDIARGRPEEQFVAAATARPTFYQPDVNGNPSIKRAFRSAYTWCHAVHCVATGKRATPALAGRLIMAMRAIVDFER